jgi:hypothetical protein
MRILLSRSRVSRWALGSLLLVATLPHGFAEDPPTPAPPAAPTPAAAAATAKEEVAKEPTSVKSSIQTPALDFLLNTAKSVIPSPGSPPTPPAGTPSSVGEMPALGAAEQEAIREKIKSLNSLTSAGFENPIVRARFEKFLNAPPANAKDIERYNTLIRNIQDALLKRDDRAAWKLLFELSRFEWDAGIGEALAGRVEATWDMKLSNAELDEKIRRLQQEVTAGNWNADLISQPSIIKSDEQARSVAGRRPQAAKAGAPNVTADNVPFVEGKMRAIAEYLKVVEGRARIKVNELKTDALELKNKADFQEYVGTLFTARRHLHVILAADFYRCLYGGGDYPPTMANQVNMAKEIVRDVGQAAKVFKLKVERDELVGAAEHLQNAFLASEFHTALLAVDLESKRKVQQLGFNLVKLQTMLEARDFGNVEPLLKTIQKQAGDFDPTKPRSIVEAVKLESRLRLGNAKLAAQQGDLKTAMSEFRSAAQTWPGNPDLDIAQLGFFNSQDKKNQLQQEFDRLIESRNYREIFDKQLPLATAIVGDTRRIEQMKSALEKVKAAEIALEKANLFRRNNNPFGAWEALDTAAGLWPEDSTLNRMRAELSAESAAFVHQLKKGEEAERTGNIGYSLACYLNAQRLYPSSEMARTAIDRLSSRVLKKDTKGPS